ncbi:hypothetical protein ARMSODRAFT_966249 [Armillaria solidipes]|uniref:Uncharacterized protein n=1 Tax=Armillaria solidipes TaxID=1076256 RepID=A0A2H3AZI5_9AGAR|nr:hypothetical protein ARMSODRAFT_966249 [Armillaria solidipes]
MGRREIHFKGRTSEKQASVPLHLHRAHGFSRWRLLVEWDIRGGMHAALMASVVLSAVADKYRNWSVCTLLLFVLAGNHVYRLPYVMVKDLLGP